MLLPRTTKKPTTAIAYYRVSTSQQGASGLGLDAQKSAVESFCARESLTIVGSFTEIETGTNKKTRVEIQNALLAAKKANAIFVIAKLDRLARNVAFISKVMESGIKIAVCDMPYADNVTLHIMAALAEYEAKLISERTKAALQAAKARGQKLGNPQTMTKETQEAAVAANKEKAIKGYALVSGYISELREKGLTLQAIADKLNSEGHTTRGGATFGASQVQRILKRIATTDATPSNEVVA